MHHAPAHPPGRPAGARTSWATLVVLAVAQFMVILDVTVVNVALPSIGEALGVAPADLQWVVTAYVLFTGGLMLLGGRLGDLLGARRVFRAGIALFTGASLLSGLAWAPLALDVSRAIQGIGAALLVPSALALLTTTYQSHQRAVALSVWGAVGSAGAAAGVLLGGVITTLLSWEWIFFINLPVGILVGLASGHLVPPDDDRARTRARLDVPGAVTAMTGLVALVYGIQQAATHGWTSAQTLVPAAAAAALLSVFAAVERRGRSPLVPPSAWRVRSLVSGAGVMLGATGILVGAFFLNTLYLQEAMDASPLETGLAFLPLTLVILVAAHVASHLLAHLGSRIVMAGGLAIAAAGALLLSGVPAHADYVTDLLPGFLALGFGIGLTFVSVSVTAMHDVAHDQAGVASGLMMTAHEVGAALGVAILASVATGGGEVASAGGLAQGYGDGFLVAAGAAAVLAIAALLAAPTVRPAPGTAVPLH